MSDQVIVAIISTVGTLIAALLGKKSGSDIKTVVYVIIPIILGSTVIIYLTQNESYQENNKWFKWEMDLIKNTNECIKNNKSFEEVDRCKKYQLGLSIKNIPYIDQKYINHDLTRNFKAGDIILTNTKDILYNDFGIIEQCYLGTGITVPKSTTSGTGGLLEYWTPNLNENQEAVWTWKFSPAFAQSGTKVREAISENKPTNESDNNKQFKFKDCIDETSEKYKNCNFKEKIDDERTPILFRCSQFKATDYKGTVGRPEAKRVFFARLRDVYDITLEKACQRTGRYPALHTDTYFVWIYIPSQEEEAVLATWENLIKNYNKWEQIGP